MSVIEEIITKAKWQSIRLKRFKNLYNHYPSEATEKSVKEGAGLEFDVWTVEGFHLVKLKKELCKE